MNEQTQEFLNRMSRDAMQTVMTLSQAIANQVQAATRSMALTTDTVHQWAEQSTETLGRIVTPFAENPLVKMGTKLPGISWLMAALGQVNVEQVQQDVAALQQAHPMASTQQLAQRVISDAAMKAAQVGLLTNFIPPAAFFLSALDMGAVAALQANMIYRISALYGFSPTDAARRGEVLAIWGLFSGGSGLLKSGLSVVELLPGIGAAVGVTSDAALLYSVGQLANQFYERKRAKDPENLE